MSINDLTDRFRETDVFGRPFEMLIGQLKTKITQIHIDEEGRANRRVQATKTGTWLWRLRGKLKRGRRGS